MQNRSEVELKPITIAKSVLVQLNEAINLLDEIKKGVKTTRSTEVQLNEIEKIVKSIQNKVKTKEESAQINDCIRKMLEQFNRLGKALTDYPKKFAALNKGQIILKTLGDIKDVLHSIDELIDPPITSLQPSL